MNQSIERIRDETLCTGCGTCAGVCYNSAIEMRRTPDGVLRPLINKSKCKKCDICVKACPGYSVDFMKLSELIFGKISDNPLLGSFLNCYLGHSTEEEIRWRASSGGIVTSLLIFLLEEGMIDGALVTRMDKNKPLEPESFIARSKKELFSACGSKYLPVPANVAWQEIKEDDKIAIVGLPCHIHGARKAEMTDKKLAKRIILHLGLFCGQGVNLFGTEFLLKKMGIPKENVTKISYRGRGWPGGMTVKLKDGSEKFMPYHSYYTPFGVKFFTPIRCTLCWDATAEFADISFGDPWLPEMKREKTGQSIILSRTEIGERILQNAQSKGIIDISEISCNKVIQSQRGQLSFKKEDFEARAKFLRLFGKKIPNYNTQLPKAQFSAWIKTLFFCSHVYVSSNPALHSLFEHVPFFALDAYCRSLTGISRVTRIKMRAIEREPIVDNEAHACMD